MKYFRLIITLAAFLPLASFAQDQWPMVLDADGRTVTIYQPQPESYVDGKFSARAAVSGSEKGKDPVFGAIWMTGFLEVDRSSRMGTITQLEVTDMRFPGQSDTAIIGQWKRYLSYQIPNHAQPISIDRLIASLESEQPKQAPAFKNEAPTILYRKEPTSLVLLDGEPVYKAVENTQYEYAVNSPYFLAREKGKSTLYLYGSSVWYQAAALDGPWQTTTTPPQELATMMAKDTAATDQGTTDAEGRPIIPKVIVCTTPTELVQTDGDAKLEPVKGTTLLFVTNSGNDIFMDVASQQYFVLLSGRWYKGAQLDGNSWTYVPADKLPVEFAKIPEGSTKGEVLSSVAGTQASKEAVLDASIPQTAKVDLNSTTTTITYDGDPKWKLIEGTAIYEAENASTTVLYIREHYYACENAVWYDSKEANGPWKVCTKVPAEVQDIPPSSPNYNVKYVQVYETTPTVVYVGYTPGYTGCYVYGPTVVYGTGYYYQPWYGAVYYPRPVTYGFSMHYNPYYGWSMGVSVNYGWMHVSMGGYHGGYWGPPMYHPPYHGGGYHGGNYHGGGNTINIDNSNNFYGGGNRGDNRPGVTPTRPSTQPAAGGSTRPSQGGGKQPSTRPSTQPAGGNNVLTDKQGNVYRSDGKGGYQQPAQNGKWENTPSTRPTNGGGATQPTTQPSKQPSKQPSTQPSTRPANQPSMSPSTQQQLDRDMQNRQRGQQNMNNYQQQQRSAPAQRSYSGGGGGGSRGGGGGGSRGGGGGRR